MMDNDWLRERGRRGGWGGTFDGKDSIHEHDFSTPFCGEKSVIDSTGEGQHHCMAYRVSGEGGGEGGRGERKVEKVSWEEGEKEVQ